MLAVLALALADQKPSSRTDFISDIAIATTSWLVDGSKYENISNSSFMKLTEIVTEYFDVSLVCFSSGLRFNKSTMKVLRDYEIGYVREGVGAGALSFLSELKGITVQELVTDCEMVVDQLDLSTFD